MNGAYAHLVLNHFPILGTLFGLALLAVALFRRSDELQRAALVTFVVVGALSLPAYFTGESAHEVLEDYPGVSEEAIEAIEVHEEAAIWAIILVELQAVLAIFSLVGAGKSGQVSRKVALACLLLSILSMAAVTRTAQAGRDIRHPEAGGTP
jgi:uncharacterized membrane protein